MMANGAELAPELAAEIAALKPFANFAAACDALNGKDGGVGLRTKYLTRLYAAGVSEPLVHSIGAAISLQCDREVALLAPIQDRMHGGGRGWTSHPLSSLTDEERRKL